MQRGCGTGCAGSQKAQRENFIAETWPQLRATTIPRHHRQEKNKVIDGVCKILKDGCIEAYCFQMLPFGLKEKPDQCGLIAQMCIKLADAHQNKSVQDLDAVISGHVGRVAEKTKVVVEAAAEMAEAQQLHESKKGDMIAAENVYLEATEEFRKLKQNEKAVTSKRKSLVKVFDTLKGRRRKYTVCSYSIQCSCREW